VNLIEFWNPKNRLNHYDVEEPEWERLYCRKGRRYIRVIPGQRLVLVDNLLQLANLTAKVPQTGAFTRLVKYIDTQLSCNIFVENVMNRGFAARLPSLGFTLIEETESVPCFFKLK
jgi:hypothetical protein